MEGLLTLTPSNVNYMACPSKAFHLIQKRQYSGTKGSSPNLRYGIGIHDVLSRLYRQPSPHDFSCLDYYMRAAFARLPYREEEEQHRDHDMERGDTLVRLYMDQMDDCIDRIIGVEQAGTEEISQGGTVLFRAYARLDLLFVRVGEPETLIVRDWRIGSTKNLEINQIFLNLLVAKSIAPGFKKYVLQVDSLNNDTGVDRFAYSSTLLKGVVHEISKSVSSYLADDVHTPIPGMECLHCGFASQCIANKKPVDAADADF